MPTHAPERLLPTTPLALLAILLTAFLVQWYWLIPNSGAEADAACYLLTARNLATHGNPAHLSPDPLVFVPEHMVEVRPGIFYPIYPIGFPALCAAAYTVGGPLAPFYINVLLFLLGLVGAFLLARLFLEDLLALAVTALLALHPALLYYSVVAMSHTAEFTLATWCLYCLAAWYKQPRAPLLIAAGALIGAAISVRYTGALLALPLACVLLLRLLHPRTAAALPPRRILLHAALAAAAALLTLAPLLLYHHHAFGSPFTTGYSLSGEASAFSLSHFLHHAPYALKALSQAPLGLSLLFPISLIAIAWLLRRDRPLGLLFLFATLPTFLLYAAYYWFIADPSPWWNPISTGSLLYIRFFLSIFPMLVIAAVLFIDRRFLHPLRIHPTPDAFRQDHHGAARRSLILAVAILLLGGLNLALFPRWNPNFLGSAATDAAALDLIRPHIPDDAIIVPDGYTAYSLLYRTSLTVYYPRYFSVKWSQERLAPGTATRPADFNPLRRQRFAAEVDQRSDAELYRLLVQRLASHARDNRPLFLLAQGSAPRWFLPLAETFDLSLIDQDPLYQLTLLRLTLKPPATQAAPPPDTAPASK